MATTLAKVKRNGPSTETGLDALLVSRQWGYADDTRRISVMQADGVTIRRFWDSTRLADQTSTYGTALIGTEGITGVTPYGGASGASSSLQAMLKGLASANTNYIANGTSLQSSSNFNVSGSGGIGTDLTLGGDLKRTAAGNLDIVTTTTGSGVSITPALNGVITLDTDSADIILTSAIDIDLTAVGSVNISGVTNIVGNTAITGTLSSSGVISANSGISFTTNGSFAAGRIVKHSSGGLGIQGITGGVYDFSVSSAAGSYVLVMPTGTNTLTALGAVDLASTLTLSSFSANRILRTTTAGLVTSDAGLTYNGSAFSVTGTGAISGNATVGGNLGLTGRLNINGATDNSGYGVNIAGKGIAISGYEAFYAYGFGTPGSADFESTDMFTSNLNGIIRVNAAGTGTFRPLLIQTGGSTAITVATNQAVTLAGTLAVTGASTLTGAVTAASSLTVSGATQSVGVLTVGSITAGYSDHFSKITGEHGASGGSQFGFICSPSFRSTSLSCSASFSILTPNSATNCNQTRVININNPVLGTGFTITDNIGLWVEPQTAGTNNWAIKTGLGKVEFGDDLIVDGTTTFKSELYYDNTGDFVLAHIDTGDIALGTLSGDIKFQPTGGHAVFESPTVPSAWNDTGTPGAFAWDANYIYICVSANAWKRVGIATF